MQRSAGLRALPQTLAAVYRRSIVLAAPLLLLSYWWTVTDAFLQTTLPPESAVLSIAAEAATTAVLLVTGCVVALALGLLGAFDLGVRAAEGNSLLILLARPGTVLGLAGLAYLLATVAGVLGPGAWLPALALFASVQTHATLLASKQLLDVRHPVREPVRYPSVAVPSNREEEGK
jgi:hypothetical protein